VYTSPVLYKSTSDHCSCVRKATCQRTKCLQLSSRANGIPTDLALDRYHGQLLRSTSHDDQLLGLASIVYWGYFTFSDSYARNKVTWLLQGRGRQSGVTLGPTNAAIANCLQFVVTRQYGQALSAFNGISQLNRTPFASKIVAFLAPDNVGVYDNRIMNGLNQANWGSIVSPCQIKNGVGQVNSKTIQRRYQNWCAFLQRIASDLNGMGPQYMWQCTERTPQVWRALDVERAIFQLFSRSASLSNLKVAGRQANFHPLIQQ
jgi:hypothetical protein